MRKNGPLLSRVVDPPETKGGLRAGNFPGPPKNTFCPEWSHHPGQKTPPNISPFFLHLPSTLGQFLICALCRRCPLLPPPPARRRRRPRAPPTSAATGRAARAPLPHRMASSPFELLPASAVVRHRRPPPASPSFLSATNLTPHRAPCPPRARRRPPPPGPDAARRHVVVLLPDLRLQQDCLAHASAVAYAPPGRPAVACARSRCTCAARRLGPVGSPAVRCWPAPPP